MRPKNRELVKKRDKRFYAMFGHMLQDLNVHRNGISVVLYPIITLIRKMWLVLTIVFMQNWPLFSILVITSQSKIMMMVIGLLSPFKSRVALNMEFLGETFAIFTIYHLLLLTDFVYDYYARDLIGKSLIGFTLANVIISVGVAGLISLSLLYRKLQLCYLAYQHARKIKSRLRS